MNTPIALRVAGAVTLLPHQITTAPQGVDDQVVDADLDVVRLDVGVVDLSDAATTVADTATTHVSDTATASATEVASVTEVASRAATEARRRWDLDPTTSVEHGHVTPARPHRSVTSGAAGRTPAPVTGRRVGVPLSSSRGRAAAWEAATALAEVLHQRPGLCVDLVATDPWAHDALGDHPVLDHPDVRVVCSSTPDESWLRAWLGTVDVVLLPYRQATDSSWVPLFRSTATAVVSVEGPTTNDLGLTATYPVAPSGLVDPDDIAAALLAILADIDAEAGVDADADATAAAAAAPGTRASERSASGTDLADRSAPSAHVIRRSASERSLATVRLAAVEALPRADRSARTARRAPSGSEPA